MQFNAFRYLYRKTPAWPNGLVVGLSLGMTALVASVDHLTGRDFAVSAFYLIPICLACWAAGRAAGMFVAGASVIAWFIADEHLGIYAHRLTPYWNALMLLVLFLVVVLLLSAFQKAHYRLEETVQHRTAALQEEMVRRRNLELAKLQAERLAVVGTMAAEVAHEVRNPLGSLTLNLDLVQKEIGKLAGGNDNAATEGHLLLREMRQEVQRIQRVIEDFLRFARLPKPQPQPVALNDVFEQKLAFLNPEFQRAGIRLQTHFDPALKVVTVDAEQLWQALLNLIRNAIEAMPEGGEITVGTWRDSKQVCLRISDTGTGMSETQLRQVFQPFFTTKARGTGLGLTLVQQIVTEHGGHVECESATGKGTTFTIVLPLTRTTDGPG